MLQGSGHGDHFLDKRNTEMLGECQAAGTGNHRSDSKIAKGIVGFLKKGG